MTVVPSAERGIVAGAAAALGSGAAGVEAGVGSGAGASGASVWVAVVLWGVGDRTVVASGAPGLAGNAVGAAVGVSVGTGVRAVVDAEVGTVASVPPGAGVTPEQASRAASMNRSRVVMGSRGFGIEGVHPSVRSAFHSTCGLSLFSSPERHKPESSTRRSGYLNLV